MKKSIYSKESQYLTEQLKKARKEASFDQKKAAKMLNRSQSHISKVECGQLRIDVVQLKEFAKIYKKTNKFFYKMIWI